MVSTYLHKLSSYLHWFLNALSLRHLQELSDIKNIVIKWKQKQKNKTKPHSRKVRLICSLRLPCWKCQNLAHANIWTSIKSIVSLICWFFSGVRERIATSLILFFFCLFLEKSEVEVAILDEWQSIFFRILLRFLRFIQSKYTSLKI